MNKKILIVWFVDFILISLLECISFYFTSSWLLINANPYSMGIMSALGFGMLLLFFMGILQLPILLIGSITVHIVLRKIDYKNRALSYAVLTSATIIVVIFVIFFTPFITPLFRDYFYYQRQSSCEKITDQAKKDECYRLFAEDENDPLLCNKMQDGEKEYCYGITSQEKNDISICEKIQSPYNDNCYLGVANASHNSSVCEKIQSQDLRNLCHKNNQ